MLTQGHRLRAGKTDKAGLVNRPRTSQEGRGRRRRGGGRKGRRACVLAPAPSPSKQQLLYLQERLVDIVPAGLVLRLGASGEPFKPSQPQCPHQ